MFHTPAHKQGSTAPAVEFAVTSVCPTVAHVAGQRASAYRGKYPKRITMVSGSKAADPHEVIATLLNASGTGCIATVMQGYIEVKVPGLQSLANGKTRRCWSVEHVRTEYQARKLIASMA